MNCADVRQWLEGGSSAAMRLRHSLASSRADGRVDCPVCGSHGSRCQEDRDNGTTVCHASGVEVPRA